MKVIKALSTLRPRSSKMVVRIINPQYKPMCVATNSLQIDAALVNKLELCCPVFIRKSGPRSIETRNFRLRLNFQRRSVTSCNVL